MLIDCDTCVGRGTACGSCVLSVILEAPPEGVEFDDDERTALAALAGGGLVPPLQLTPRPGQAPAPSPNQTDGRRTRRAAG